MGRLVSPVERTFSQESMKVALAVYSPAGQDVETRASRVSGS